MILVSSTASIALDCDERQSKRLSFALSHVWNLGAFPQLLECILQFELGDSGLVSSYEGMTQITV